jgi:hypothetical protein
MSCPLSRRDCDDDTRQPYLCRASLLFARDKRLRRFRGMLRAPRDTYCDACGSSMPNHLFGLRDMDTKRDYFVGANCMSRLSQMLVLERPFVKADIVAAYVLARNMPEKLKLPHQVGFDASEQVMEEDDAASGS